ncbi:hypothetical protein M413DRAFT_284647 [Hebeloma cylindrosporum]|uniref:Uncharacterized protein n=1 Tax=Hebeloma cylindrosporum TaxID=76867 RepID=A0A0C3BXK4_HEBCY|nr:hypothetical protein M413DRAFT_284647 [Hebeloma cylindrosporum h7]
MRSDSPFASDQQPRSSASSTSYESCTPSRTPLPPLCHGILLILVKISGFIIEEVLLYPRNSALGEFLCEMHRASRLSVQPSSSDSAFLQPRPVPMVGPFHSGGPRTPFYCLET